MGVIGRGGGGGNIIWYSRGSRERDIGKKKQIIWKKKIKKMKEEKINKLNCLNITM